MITQVTYDTSKVAAFNKLDDTASRHQLIVAMMTVSEMRRFFTGNAAKDMTISLNLPPQRSERANCEAIFNHFNSGVKL